jgi:hypothetical protein
MTFRRQSLLIAMAIVPSVLLAAGCGSSSATLTSMAVTPSPVRLAVGGTSQLTLTGSYSDGTRAPVAGATYTTSDAAVAAVNSAGTVTALRSGTATVTASASGLTATVTVTVSAGPVVLQSIAVLPPGVPLRPGATAQLTVMGTYSDGAVLNVTSGSTFSSASSGVATVSAGGLVTAVADGTATITATHTASGLVATDVVTVSTAAPTLVSIAVVPATVPLVVGSTGQLTVSGTYSDKRVVDVTAGCTFVSANEGVATVVASGLVTARGAGTAAVTATHTASGLIGSATVSVTTGPVPVISSFAAAPASILLGGSSTLSWSVSGATSLSINQGVGVVTGTSTSVSPTATTTYTLTATNGSGSATATAIVTVTLPVPVIASFTAAPTSIASGASSTLSWSVTGATSLSINQGVGTVTGTSTSVSPTVTTTYTLTATNSAGNATATAIVTVTGTPANPGAVFLGSYPAGVNPLAGFPGSETEAHPVTIDATVTNNGNPSLKIAGTSSCVGSFIGGYIASAAPKDLHAYNAISFWAKTDVPNTKINNFGFGNDNTPTGTNAFNVESHGPAAPFTGYALTTTFTKYYIPVPTPAALTAVSGLFYFSGPCIAAGANVWVNDIQFETLTPSQVTSTFGAAIEALTQAPGTLAVSVGTPQLIENIGPNTVNYASASAYRVGWGYFTYASSDTGVATVDGNGMVLGHAAGPANITMTFPGTALSRVIAVTVTAPLAVPTTLAATPTKLAANVIAMYNSSGVYTDVAINNWADFGDPGTVNDFDIAGKKVKQYPSLSYVGAGFYGANAIDASTFTHLHIDVWTPNATQFGVKLVNFAPPAQTEAELDYNTTTTPAITTGTWLSLDIPLADFTAKGLGGLNNLQQMLFIDNVGGPERATFYIDNVYFWK